VTKTIAKFNLAARVKALAIEQAGHHKMTEEERELFYKAKHEGCTDVLELAHRMAECTQVYDYMSAMKTMAGTELDMLRLQLIPAAMETAGIENVRIEDLGRLGLAGDMYVSVKAGCNDKFLAWLNKHKLGDLAKPTVNSSTLKAFVKARKLAGKPLPDDLLNITPYTRASITKA